MFGEASLLASYAELAPRMTYALFEAGRTGDAGELMRLQHAFARMGTDLWAQPKPGPHMDGAYDKMLVKLGMLPEFPLRLLSPYRGFDDDDYRRLPALPPGRLRRLARTRSQRSAGVTVRLARLIVARPAVLMSDPIHHLEGPRGDPRRHSAYRRLHLRRRRHAHHPCRRRHPHRCRLVDPAVGGTGRRGGVGRDDRIPRRARITGSPITPSG